MTMAQSAFRLAVILVLPFFAAACTTAGDQSQVAALAVQNSPDLMRYGAVTDEQFPIPAVAMKDLSPKNRRQLIDYPTDQPPGTLIVDPQNRFLYLVQEGGKAMRYGVGVGKAGLEFTGTGNIGYKRQWPRWTPTQDMIKREPERYGPLASGMEPGPTNPLGARALYLFKDGKDTLFRIHGTNETWSIGQAVSSGCIRMMNQDVIDLYGRVPNGSKVVVL